MNENTKTLRKGIMITGLLTISAIVLFAYVIPLVLPTPPDPILTVVIPVVFALYGISGIGRLVLAYRKGQESRTNQCN